jgi:hypothetical protein
LPSFSDLRAWRMIENDRNIHGPSKYLEKWWKLRSPTNGVDDVDFLKQSFTKFYGSLEGLGPGGPGRAVGHPLGTLGTLVTAPPKSFCSLRRVVIYTLQTYFFNIFLV